MTKAPTTPDEWWNNLNDNWSKILETANITGYNPDARNLPGDSATVLDKPYSIYLEEARAAMEHEPLLQFVNAIWHNAPDRPEIHSYPAWDVICDLCSECWVFYETAE